MSIVRSILAVLGGIAIFSVALFVMEPVFDLEGHNTSARQLLWLGWLTLSMVAGGVVTAWIAPRAQAPHAIGMAVLQAVMTFVAMLTVRDADQQPLWSWLAGIALMVPAAWVGARLRSRRQRV